MVHGAGTRHETCLLRCVFVARPTAVPAGLAGVAVGPAPRLGVEHAPRRPPTPQRR